MINNIVSRIAKADDLKSVDALEIAINNGTIPGYIGVPMIAELVKNQKEAQALQQGAPTSTVAQQVLQQAQSLNQPQQPMPYGMAASDRPPIPTQVPPQNPMPPREMVAGIDAAQSNLPTQNMASGGIVAFAGGGEADAEYDPFDDEDNEEYYADMEHQSKLAQLIAQGEADSEALTQDLLENPGDYAGIKNAGVGIKYKEPIPVGGSKGLQDLSFVDKIRHLESRGRSYDNNGNILTSSKGAMGPMQTMPATLRDPGFGVKPAQDNSVAEMDRVGREYALALKNYYKGNERDAAAAYNWGPGNFNKYVAAGRQGFMPKETQQYASNFAEGGIVGLAAGGKVPGFSGGVYITDPAGNTRLPNYPLTNPNAPVPSATSRALVPYQSPATVSQGLAEAPPTWFQKYIQPNIGKANRAIGAAITEAPMVGAGVPIIGGLLSAGATNALSNATDEQLEQLQGDIGSDTSLAAAIIAQGRKNEAAKPPVKEEKKVVEAAKEDANKIQNNVQEETKKDLDQGDSPYAAQAKAEKTMFEDMQAAIKRREASLESEKSIDGYLALLQGFLGMMGGTSPYAMVNVGQGASSGINTLLAARKQTGLAERALGRDQMSLLTAQNALNRQGIDRDLRERALRNQETRLTNEERVKSANAYENARKDMVKEFGFNLIQYNNLKQKAIAGKLNEKEKETYDSLNSMYEDIDRRARNQVYGGGNGTMPGFRIVDKR